MAQQWTHHFNKLPGQLHDGYLTAGSHIVDFPHSPFLQNQQKGIDDVVNKQEMAGFRNGSLDSAAAQRRERNLYYIYSIESRTVNIYIFIFQPLLTGQFKRWQESGWEKRGVSASKLSLMLLQTGNTLNVLPHQLHCFFVKKIDLFCCSVSITDEQLLQLDYNKVLQTHLPFLVHLQEGEKPWNNLKDQQNDWWFSVGEHDGFITEMMLREFK